MDTETNERRLVLAKSKTPARISRRRFLASAGALGAGAIFSRMGLMGSLAAAPAGGGLIDVHHHFAPAFYIEEAREQFVRTGNGGALKGPLAEWTAEKSLAEMDRNGVEYAVLSLTTPAVWMQDMQASRKLARRCNDYAAELAAKNPTRFGFFAAIPLPDTEGSLQEIDHALGPLKANGIGFLTSYDDKWPGDAAFAPVFEELNRRKAVVYFHPSAPACCRTLIPSVPAPTLEFPHDTTRAIISLLLSGSLARFSEIKFIFSHAGGTMPMVWGRIAQLAGTPAFAEKVPNGVEYELKRLHYEIANSGTKSAISALMNLVPTSQILFGTDFPFYATAVTADGMRTVGLSEAELNAIGRENATRVLGRSK